MIQYIFIILFTLIAIALIFILRTLSYPVKIRKAEEYMEDGEYGKSSEIIKGILEKRKDYVPARYLRAQILMKQGQYLLAISELNSILTLPDFGKYIKELDIHYHLANLYNLTKNYPKEIEEYRIILTFNPDDLNANHRIGHAYYRKKDYRRVKEHLTKAIIIDPALKDCYLPLGISCFKISDYVKAEEYLTQAMKVPGNHTDAEFYLGLIYKMKKDYDNAFLMLDKAKSKKEYTVKSHYNIGEIHYEMGQYREAIDVLEKGLPSVKEKNEEALAYRYLLAECYEHENKIKEAVHHWEKIAAENPDFRSTKIKLDSYRQILEDNNLMTLFNTSLEELQPMIIEIISSLNYNIISKERITANEYQYKAYNIKRINDPPILIYFNRTTREISEGQIIEFQKNINNEKCKSGIYITTSRLSLRAKSGAQTKGIDYYDAEFVNRSVEKILSRKKHTKPV